MNTTSLKEFAITKVMTFAEVKYADAVRVLEALHQLRTCSRTSMIDSHAVRFRVPEREREIIEKIVQRGCYLHLIEASAIYSEER